MKRADVAIENSSSMLNDEELFGCADSSFVTGCEEELDEVFGERGVEYERYDFCVIFCIFLNTSNIYFSFSAMMK